MTEIEILDLNQQSQRLAKSVLIDSTDFNEVVPEVLDINIVPMTSFKEIPDLQYHDYTLIEVSYTVDNPVKYLELFIQDKVYKLLSRTNKFLIPYIGPFTITILNFTKKFYDLPRHFETILNKYYFLNKTQIFDPETASTTSNVKPFYSVTTTSQTTFNLDVNNYFIYELDITELNEDKKDLIKLTLSSKFLMDSLNIEFEYLGNFFTNDTILGNLQIFIKLINEDESDWYSIYKDRFILLSELQSIMLKNVKEDKLNDVLNSESFSEINDDKLINYFISKLTDLEIPELNADVTLHTGMITEISNI